MELVQLLMTEVETEQGLGGRPSGGEDPEGISVLLIEQDDLIRQSLMDWLASVLAEARLVGLTFEEAERRADHEEPAVIVVDIALIGRDGIDVVADLHKAFPDAQIVALSMGEDKERHGAVLAAGAAACLPAWQVRDKLEATLYRLLGRTP